MIATIELSPDQEAWLQKAVASGQFSSVEEAMQNGIETLRAASGTPICDLIGITQERLDADIAAAEASHGRGESREIEPLEKRLARLREQHPNLANNAPDS